MDADQDKSFLVACYGMNAPVNGMERFRCRLNADTLDTAVPKSCEC